MFIQFHHEVKVKFICGFDAEDKLFVSIFCAGLSSWYIVNIIILISIIVFFRYKSEFSIS